MAGMFKSAVFYYPETGAIVTGPVWGAENVKGIL